MLPGIESFWIGGHTPGSTAYRIHTSAGWAVITGDTISLLANFEHNTPPGVFSDLEQCRAAIDKVRAKTDIVLPSHDPSTPDRWPPSATSSRRTCTATITTTSTHFQTRSSSPIAVSMRRPRAEHRTSGVTSPKTCERHLRSGPTHCNSSRTRKSSPAYAFSHSAVTAPAARACSCGPTWVPSRSRATSSTSTRTSRRTALPAVPRVRLPDGHGQNPLLSRYRRPRPRPSDPTAMARWPYRRETIGFTIYDL